jgi:ATP-dependent Clp protease ATP-binding subunit ClpA
VYFARHEALQREWRCIEPEHLALGMLYEDTPTLRRAWPPGITSLADVKRRIEASLPAGRAYQTPIDISLSEDAKAVIRASAAASARLGHDEVGLEHLLLGLTTYERTLWSRLAGGFVLKTLLRGQGLDPGVIEAHARKMRARS